MYFFKTILCILNTLDTGKILKFKKESTKLQYEGFTYTYNPRKSKRNR